MSVPAFIFCLMPPQAMEQSSCTEDRIQHVLERCLCDLGLNPPDKAVWNGKNRAGLSFTWGGERQTKS